MKLSNYQSPNIYFNNHQTKIAIFIATVHEKTIMAVIFNVYKYFLHFELLTSNNAKKETQEKFKNLPGINLVKNSSKFLVDIESIYVIQAHLEMCKIIS